MATLIFDTHKAVKALRDAGFDDSQAEAVTEQISVAIGENLATKDDLWKNSSCVSPSRCTRPSWRESPRSRLSIF